RHRYDVVHAHSSIGGAVTRIAAQIVPRSMRPKVVYTPHGFAFLAGSAFRRSVFRLIERLLGLATDRMIAVSPTEADVAVEHGVVPRDRVVAIPNGIDPSVMPRPEHRDDVRAREGWGDAPVVMTVARMTPQKDPGTWLRVAARIAAACTDVRFVW
ncbi:MAG: glycosyltransferase, partial [Chloroflexi bacterium]|nr:glycosyltransferase [Chloroflexota bacterium]